MANVVESIMQSVEFSEKVLSSSVAFGQLPRVTSETQTYIGRICASHNRKLRYHSKGQRNNKLLKIGHLDCLCCQLCCV